MPLLSLKVRVAADREADLRALLGALEEPAAICEDVGTIRLANGAWREIVGVTRAPFGHGEGLFAAFLTARREGRGEGEIRRAGDLWKLTIRALNEDRFLLRLARDPKTAAAPEAAPLSPPPPPVASAPSPGLGASPFAAALINGDEPFAGAIVEANAALQAIAGGPVPSGTSLGGLIAPRSLSDARAAWAAGRPSPFEVILSTRPEKTAHLYLSRTAAGTVAHFLDVTDQKALQMKLAQRNKMEAIGQLAGGVAHDFNNLLSGARLRVDELLARHPLGDPSYESLAEILGTVQRAADVVRQLMAFTRQTTLRRETLDLGAALSDFEVMLRRLLREDVQLLTDYGRDLPLVRADKAQLENALINLVVNARDALRAQGGGAIRLTTARLTPSEAANLGYDGPDGGDLALIEVADDGPGIAPEVIANIFEPFFTTKPLGEGTGLGLATVHGIVKQSGGWIAARSTPGQGAAFRIFLPAYAPPLTVESPAPPAPTRAAARDLSGVGRILFVEDEDLVRGIAARLLRARGYEVIEARDGDEALALAQAHAGGIDLMISDVVMPGMDGPSLLKAARPFLGTAPVMFISGYAEAEFSNMLEGEAGVSFLAKPLDIKTLAERVKLRLAGG